MFHNSNDTTWSQILIIAQTLKALDFLLKKSVLTTVVFYTHKKTQEGRVFIGSMHIEIAYLKRIQPFCLNWIELKWLKERKKS